MYSNHSACISEFPHQTLESLAKACFNSKVRFLRMYKAANAGHVGSSLSCAELLTFIGSYCSTPLDTLILSKGHAAAALYSMLCESGKVSEKEIETFYKDGTIFSAHPPPGKIHGIPFATGSLGHGLGLAAGVALGNKFEDPKSRNPAKVFCVLSDGELNEGSIWEAVLFASRFSLTNLIAVVDRNRLQGFGRTEEVMPLEPLIDKFQAFGWSVCEVDGHSFPALIDAYEHGQKVIDRENRPLVLLANTVKGRGLRRLQDTVDCHYLPMNDEDYAAILEFCEREYAERVYGNKERAA